MKFLLSPSVDGLNFLPYIHNHVRMSDGKKGRTPELKFVAKPLKFCEPFCFLSQRQSLKCLFIASALSACSAKQQSFLC